MSLQMGSRRTRGPWGPDDWKDSEAWLAQRGEFTRAGHGVPDNFARYPSHHGADKSPRTGWPRTWPPGDDAAYAQWRDATLRGFDEDYEAWRSERYRRFAQEFDAWRSRRRQSGVVDADGGGR